MLSQANHWLLIVGTVLDVALLGRVLQLRLYRLYVFITLGCVLAAFFDGVALWLEADPKSTDLVFVYSRVLYALVFPLIAWDVFEEFKTQIAKLRRLAITRMVSALLFACLFGFILAVADAGDDSVPIILALVVWAGSSTATLGFLWTLHRQMRAQKVELPNNTHVWLVFWQLSLLSEVLVCFWFFFSPLVKSSADYVQLLFSVYDIAITAWCVVRLRAVPTSVPSPSANAS